MDSKQKFTAKDFTTCEMCWKDSAKYDAFGMSYCAECDHYTEVKST